MSGFKIIPSKHFAERLQERKIDLSLVALIHQEIAKNPFQEIYKLISNNSAIIFGVDRDKGIITIITGYPVK
ncbi:TPA: hypothetical protein R6B34_001741 [Campylobacter coli]|nr:hypothetical protein [Campylobacter coli]